MSKSKNGEKKVTVAETEKVGEVRNLTERLEEIKKDLMGAIAKEMGEQKKERKRCMEIVEERRNKERNWEIRIRMLEEKIEEVVKEIKDLKEQMEVKGREDEQSREDSEGGLSRERKSLSRRGSSCGGSRYTDISEHRLSTREVGKIKRWLMDRVNG